MGARDEVVDGSGMGEGDGESVAAEPGSGWDFSRGGGRSVVECLPVVQGGMDRNSSNVRTRGLQHFHPVQLSKYMFIELRNGLYFRRRCASQNLPFCPSWKIGGPGWYVQSSSGSVNFFPQD